MNRGWRRGLLLGVLLLGGCGTIGSLANDQKIYGGVRHDADEIGNSNQCSSGLVAVFDTPFSAALDTAALPFTLIYAIFRPAPHAPPPPAHPEPSMPNPNTR
jgi:uncharacterized protein YceK